MDRFFKRRQKAMDVINLLSEQGAVDEQGIGIVRDAFANYFFPGTSTIQTRAKYFLIVPYILKEAVDGRYGKDINKIMKAIDLEEKECGIRFLKANQNAEGSRRYPVARLRFNTSRGEVRGMSLFCLLYPSKTLANMYSPIASVNQRKSLNQIERDIRMLLAEKLQAIEKNVVVVPEAEWMIDGIICPYADGCFQAMFDEYFHMLEESTGFSTGENKTEHIPR